MRKIFAIATVAALVMVASSVAFVADEAEAGRYDGDYGVYDLGQISKRTGSGQKIIEFTEKGGYKGMAEILGKNSLHKDVSSNAPDWVTFSYDKEYRYNQFSSNTYVFATLTFDFDRASATDGGYQILVTNWSHSVILKFSLKATAPSNIVLSFSGDIGGVSGVPGSQSWTGYGSHTFNVPWQTPYCEGMTFQGWSTSAGGSVTYHPGDSVTLWRSTTLHAIWQAVPVAITTEPPSGGLVGSSITYDVGTNLRGCSLQVDGPSWLVADGNRLIGTPNGPGDYPVKVVVSLAGHGQAEQSFMLSVHSVLEFVKGPEAGMMAYEG